MATEGPAYTEEQAVAALKDIASRLKVFTDFPLGSTVELGGEEEQVLAYWLEQLKGINVDFAGVLDEIVSYVTAAQTAAANVQSAARTYAAWDDGEGGGLVAQTGDFDGQVAEVVTSSEATHADATATGYDGAAVPDNGLYAWRTEWARWVRIGDTGLSGKADTDQVETEVARGRQSRRAFLDRDGVAGYALPILLRDGSVIGLRSDGSLAMPAIRLLDTRPTTARDVRTRWPVIRDDEGRIAVWMTPAGRLAGMLDALTVASSGANDRDVPLTQLAGDAAGRSAIAVRGDGSVLLRMTQRSAAAAYDRGPSFRLRANIGGCNHRRYDDAHVLATMPALMGACDAVVPLVGDDHAFADTRLPTEYLSGSGQSNTIEGEFVLRDAGDPHRAFRTPQIYYGDGTDSPSAYAGGGIDQIVAISPYEYNSPGTFTPDVVQLACIGIDTRDQHPQRVYVQATSARGGTPLTDYLAGTTKGDQIYALAAAMQAYLANAYDRDLICYAHFLYGHEAGPHDGGEGYDTYADLLSAFADEVCGWFEANLAGNIAAGVRPKVIAYQIGDRTGGAGADAPLDYKTMKQAAIDTLHAGLNDPDVVCAGPAYDEPTKDDGLHFRHKLMLGERMAHVYSLIRAGQDFAPLHVSAASRVDNVITLTVAGPVGKLHIDDDWMPAVANLGLHYGDDGDTAVITDVSIVNDSATDRAIVVTLDAIPTGANKAIYIGAVNSAVEGWGGGLTSIYSAGPQSVWYRRGYSRWCTPEIRHRLCRDIVNID